MADLLFKNGIKFLAIVLILGYGSFQCAQADFSLSDFPETNILETLDAKYTGRTSGQKGMDKKEYSPEQKAEMKLAKEELKARKIPLTSQEFIKQIKKGNIAKVELMMRAGMSPDTDYYGDYPLCYAAKKNRTEIALLLLEKGASPSIGFDSPLMIAVKKGNTVLAKELIERGSRLDYTDLISSKSLLYMTVKNKQYGIAKLMLEKGARLDRPTAILIERRNLYGILGIERP